MKSVSQSVGTLKNVSDCRHACLELSGPVQMTACSQEFLFTLQFLVTAVCASLSFDYLHLGCPSECFQSFVCLWKPCVQGCHKKYLWCPHVMGMLCSVLLWSQCTLRLDVWKRYPFSPQQENSLNSFSLLILLLFVTHILVACSYMSIASCSYREFLPSIFFEACKHLWFVNPCEDWQNGTVYMSAGGFGSSLSGASVDTRYHLPEELKWALCTTSCLCSCEAYE